MLKYLFILLLVSCYQQPSNEKILRFGIDSIPSSLNVSKPANVSVFSILNPVHLGLVVIKNNKIYDGIAYKWEIKQNNTEYHFHLKNNLFFHNKEKLTCETVNENFRSMIDGRRKSFVSKYLTQSDCINNILVLKTNQYVPSLLEHLSRLDSVIIPITDIKHNNHINGLGSFKIISKSDTQVILSNVKPKKTNLKKIIIIKYKNTKEGIRKYKNDELDVLKLRGLSDQYKDLNLKINNFYSRLWYIGLGNKALTNFTKKELICLNLSFPREELLESIDRKELFSKAYGVIPEQSLGHINKPKPFRKRKCIKKNKKLNFIMIKTEISENLSIALKKILFSYKLNAKFTFLDKSDFIKTIISGNYEMHFSSFGVGSLPERVLEFFYSSDPFIKLTNLSEENFDKELDNISYSAGMRDREHRILKFQMQQLQKPYIIPLLFKKEVYLAKDYITLDKYFISSSSENIAEIKIHEK